MDNETGIPEVILNLKNLETIRWSGCVVSLPDDIMAELPKLKELCVTLTKIPKSIIEQIAKGGFEQFVLDIGNDPHIPPEEIARLEKAIEVGIKANPNMRLRITYPSAGATKVFTSGMV